MKCRILFSEKKNMTYLSFAEFAQRVVKVRGLATTGRIPASFYKADKAFDFLLGFLFSNPLLKRVLL